MLTIMAVYVSGGNVYAFFYRYIFEDFFVPVWPNIAASAVLGLWAMRRFIRLEKLHHSTKRDIFDLFDRRHKDDKNNRGQT